MHKISVYAQWAKWMYKVHLLGRNSFSFWLKLCCPSRLYLAKNLLCYHNNNAVKIWGTLKNDWTWITYCIALKLPHSLYFLPQVPCSSGSSKYGWIFLIEISTTDYYWYWKNLSLHSSFDHCVFLLAFSHYAVQVVCQSNTVFVVDKIFLNNINT